jgi:hypothetical protein
MKSLLNKILISIIVLGGILPAGRQGLLSAPDVFAQSLPNLVVQFQPNPLFNQVNFFPGDTVTGSATVTNNTVDTQKIGTQAVNVNNPDHAGYRLGDVMNLQITQGVNTLYSGTLSQFFSAGEIYLSDLAGNGANATYYYSITFDPNSGDNYQGLGLGFDISVGFFGAESISTEVPVNGGGGGGGYTSDNLIISNERIIAIGPDSVTIAWDTNLISSSRVIYSIIPAPSFNINNPPNYNYSYSTIDDINKVLNHSVVITGLTPGTNYVFRCVSHASPDTLSPEYSFATLGVGATTENIQQELNPTGEVLGEATFRTALPETGGLMGRITRKMGLSSKGLFDYEINILFGGIFILLMIGLVIIRKVVLK